MAWLSKRGTVEEIQHSFEVNAYIFRSLVDIETIFCSKNKQLLIYLGENNFSQSKREETSEKSLNLKLAKISSKYHIQENK
ncbi:MAG: hypothetical protein SAJ37_20165 [Oscillatoria sp. PMC 1068.18]|nr:hypothetical protein [Oscillatoria sp. PMC 1076.18]MEC4991056.1 hypothetical protein [Oscillatoria sp. PMC 1068.18]